MRVVIQRVKRASVTTEKEEHEEGGTTQSAVAVTVSDIGKGLLCLVGVHEGDTREDAEWLCKRIVSAKLFEGMSETNSDKRWRSNVKQNAFEILVVSQFTLNGRVCSKGKVDFTGSMPPVEAKVFYEGFLEMLKVAHSSPALVKDGVFGAKMDVALVNDGPITVTVDSSERREGAAAAAAAPAPNSKGHGGNRGERGI